jgi:hypothetical protein
MFNSLGQNNFQFITPSFTIRLKWIFSERSRWRYLTDLNTQVVYFKLKKRFA